MWPLILLISDSHTETGDNKDEKKIEDEVEFGNGSNTMVLGPVLEKQHVDDGSGSGISFGE